MAHRIQLECGGAILIVGDFNSFDLTLADRKVVSYFSDAIRPFITQPIATEKEKLMSTVVSTPLPKDHPMMKAWDAFCDTDEFKTALWWSVKTTYDDGRPVNDVQREQHCKGAMWLAFTKGMEVGATGAEGEKR